MDREPPDAQTPGELLGDVEASVAGAHTGLGGVLGLLAGCRPGHRLRARELRALLLPVADQVAQAAHALRTARRRRLRR